MAERCRASCKFRTCTGLGHLETWAHVCSVLGIPAAVPSCVVPECDEPSRLYLAGHLCERHGPPPAPVPGPPIRATPSWTRRAPEDYGPVPEDPTP